MADLESPISDPESTDSGLVKIHYPQAGKLAPPGGLASYGNAAPGVGAVVAVLIGSSRVYVADTLREPPRWVVFFEGVAAGTYQLLITDYWEGTILATLDNVKVGMKPLVGIIYPPAPADVCADNFVTYGHTDEDSPVQATITIGGDTYTSDQLQGPPDTPDWVIQFTNLPVGADATLTVTNTNGSFETRTPLNVKLCPAPGGE
jgi:hypothetical protein